MGRIKTDRNITAARVLALILALLLALAALGISPGAARAEEPAPSETPLEASATPEPEPEPEPEFEEESSPAGAAALSKAAPLPEHEEAEDASLKITMVDGYPCVAGEVLVQFRRSASDASVRAALKAVEAENPEEIANNLHVVEVPEGETIPGYIETLESQPNVLFAQPNYVYYLPETKFVPASGLPENYSPSDLTTPPTNDPGLSLQWHLDKIGAFSAWNITMGDSSVCVAVLDTGADLTHPDFVGRIDLAKCKDVVDNDGSAQDDDGHGTHVAGIIAATANNGQYGAGVAPGVSLMIVDVFHKEYDPEGDEYISLATSEDIVAGIYHAIHNGADVINMSLGGYSVDQVEIEAVNAAAAAGVVVVAAAGNENTSDAIYPGDLESVICVTATGPNDEFASYSNYGPAKDIAAPGGNGVDPLGWIFSTYPLVDPITGNITNGYAWGAGTSMAAPVVSGVAALMLSADPSLSVDDIKSKLYNSAVDLGEKGKDIYFGHGRVNAAAAVLSARGISTSSFAINRRTGFLTGVPVGTSLPALRSALTIPYGSLSFYDAQDNPVSDGIVKTGMTVKLFENVSSDASVLEKLTIAVKGDVSGDGGLSIADYTLLRVYLLNLYTLSPAAAVASDVTSDGKLDVSDYTNIRLALLKVKPLG